MARKPRIHYPGALYHVILRGNAQENVFRHDVDRVKFCLLTQEGTERFDYRIHAFCLMDNHIHLALQIGEYPLSRSMHNLTFRYTQWFNRRYKRIGHLFQGRYKANLVDADSYLLQLASYIHLNPVRAGICRDPSVFRLSSHRFYAGEEVLPWLTEDLILGQFEDHTSEARERFHHFVISRSNSEASDYEFDPTQSDGRLIGDEQFIERVQEAEDRVHSVHISLEDIIKAVCEVYGMCQEELVMPGRGRMASEARSIVGLLIQERPDIRIADAAQLFGRDNSTVSAGAMRLRRKMLKDAKACERMTRIEDRLQNAISNA